MGDNLQIRQGSKKGGWLGQGSAHSLAPVQLSAPVSYLDSVDSSRVSAGHAQRLSGRSQITYWWSETFPKYLPDDRGHGAIFRC